jgi:indolepyruvate ferredoxin oxidoreductase, beta subunit
MHPRVEELADTLPPGPARWLLAAPWIREVLKRAVLRERRIHTSKLGGFLLLYGLASLRRFRRSTYRYAMEQGRIDAWLRRIADLAPKHYGLALEVALCQNLIKGYGDTHARGLSNFELIMTALDGRPASADTAAVVRELRDAALADEDGRQLHETLRRVA